jgi:CRP/FNR family transcriptional regulator
MITVQTISAYGLFTGLSETELERVITLMTIARFDAGALILRESTLSSDLYILKSGRISIELDVSSYNMSGREQIVILRPGDIFGEIAFLENKRRSAHVVALDPVEAIQMDGARLKELFVMNYKIGYSIMSNIALTLTHRLIDTNFKWRNGIRGNPPY